MAKKKDKEFTYEIIEICETLEEKNNWAKVLMRVSWNGGPVVYDIRNIDMRTIDSDKIVMGKGISLDNKCWDILINKLLDEGFGDEKEINKILKQRNKIFGPKMRKVRVRRIA